MEAASSRLPRLSPPCATASRSSTATPSAVSVEARKLQPRTKQIIAAWQSFQPLSGRGLNGVSPSALRAALPRRVRAGRHSPPAAACDLMRGNGIGRHNHRRPPAPLQHLRLEVHTALAQHHPRSRRCGHPQCRNPRRARQVRFPQISTPGQSIPSNYANEALVTA